MSRRSETWNAYESKLAGPLPSLSTSVAVESTAGLEDPAYIVIDPDKPTLREWIRVGTITPGLFENIVRNQEGSVGNIDHQTGAIVRAVFTKQLQDDIFDDVEDIEGAVLSHVNPVQQPDPHDQYLLELTAENTYLALAGNPNHQMTGVLRLRGGDPSLPEEATPKVYVDALVGAIPPQTFLHADLTDVGSSDHHVRYDDDEARAAVGTPWTAYLPLTGGTLTGDLRITGGDRIWFDGVANTYLRLDTTDKMLLVHDNNVVASRDAAGEYVYSGGAIRTSPSNITTLGGQIQMAGNRIQGLGNANSDDDALNLGMADGRYAPIGGGGYLPLTGGTLSGPLTLPAGNEDATSLRFGNMAANDGIWGNTTELSIGMDSGRHLTVWAPATAGSRDSGVIEMRGGAGATYILSGDNDGTAFKLTAKALEWLMSHNNG